MEAGLFSEGGSLGDSEYMLAGERTVESGNTGSGSWGMQELHPSRKELELI